MILPRLPGRIPFMSSDRKSDLSLVAGVLAGECEAVTRFLELSCALLCSVVQKLEPGPEGEVAVLHVIEALKANEYARLKAFDGRARLPTYLVLVARDVLSARLAHRLSASPRAVWPAFERFFECDLRRRI